MFDSRTGYIHIYTHTYTKTQGRKATHHLFPMIQCQLRDLFSWNWEGFEKKNKKCFVQKGEKGIFVERTPQKLGHLSPPSEKLTPENWKLTGNSLGAVFRQRV